MAAKYTQKQIDALGAQGKAFKNPDGSYSYPINDADDLTSAIRAVGRGNASHNALRKYIMRRAKALNKSDAIPENWLPTGQLKAGALIPDNDAKMLQWRTSRLAPLLAAQRQSGRVAGVTSITNAGGKPVIR